MTERTPTGLLVLHGNRLELLAATVLEWLARNPLAPLEQETLLVQSNGMAEWLKMEIASAHGVCASATVELPARFLWRAYRAVLGPAQVPPSSPLDQLPLTWRLMSLLPVLAQEPVFAPVAGFLRGGDAARRLQLAQRLADLFDQYQVYRADWLRDWSEGTDRIRNVAQPLPAHASEVPNEQRWQPALWRALLATLTPSEQEASRGALHQRFVGALQAQAGGAVRAFPRLPRRIVLFGTTHIPHQALEAIAALSSHCQVLLAVPNPCRYHWADIVEGREMLRHERRRHALRGDVDLAAVPAEDLHLHGHPLLAAWGRQARDFVRQLDAFDDAETARQRFQLPRIDLFDEAPGGSLLEQVQGAVRDLLPLKEHPRPAVRSDDRSIVFHVAHSAQREVEILHDQLLHLLAHPPHGQALAPRDIVVMVPDIDTFAPAICSVFGQYPRADPRHIPWGIADQKSRGRHPLLVALEWLLAAPHERFGASQVRDLLDVPAVAARFAIGAADIPLLVRWIEGAGVRWGLHAAHREGLGLAAAGEQNTWAFGLRRMLLGYATGEADAAPGYAGVEPYPEVAGLAAGLAGALAELLHTLTLWWADARTPQRPAEWAQRLRRLVGDLFKATEDTERDVLGALATALAQWLEACEAAGFTEALDLAVVREAWLGAVDEPQVSRRFKAGGVTFCTLLPLRAIPFQVVCLLGMNDTDYPRRGSRIDFDLMGLRGQGRPGDRSRRDDDRQLMLDALLSARRVLYVSWSGRSLRDNTPQPPSVLVSQLRDYLEAGWGEGVLAQRTTEHPLQPFSRRYFEAAHAEGPAALVTYATEWRAAHGDPVARAPQAAAAPAAPLGPLTLTVQSLAAFLRNPVKAFFRHRLQVVFEALESAEDDDEVFEAEGLERWAWADEVLRACQRALGHGQAPATREHIEALLEPQVARLQRAGRLPMAGPGRLVKAELMNTMAPMVAAWQAARAERPHALDRQPLRLAHPDHEGLVLDDWLVGLQASGPAGAPVWIECQASRVTEKTDTKKAPPPQPDKLAEAWVRCLASAACGCPADGILIDKAAVVRVRAPQPQEALPLLLDLMAACQRGLLGDEPLPTVIRTAVTWLQKPEDPDPARKVYEDQPKSPGEGQEPCLARLFPSFDHLCACPGFEEASRTLYAAYAGWLGSHVTVKRLGIEDATAEAGDD